MRPECASVYLCVVLPCRIAASGPRHSSTRTAFRGPAANHPPRQAHGVQPGPRFPSDGLGRQSPCMTSGGKP